MELGHQVKGGLEKHIVFYSLTLDTSLLKSYLAREGGTEGKWERGTASKGIEGWEEISQKALPVFVQMLLELQTNGGVCKIIPLLTSNFNFETVTIYILQINNIGKCLCSNSRFPVTSQRVFICIFWFRPRKTPYRIKGRPHYNLLLLDLISYINRVEFAS